MPVVKVPVGKMNLDRGPSPGEHMWVVKDMAWSDNGYEKLPEWSQTVTQSFSGVSGSLYGAHSWIGNSDPRMYVADADRFYEVSDSAATNVTGTTTPTNSTNNVTFASYGEWCFAANGVDRIQTIKVPSALASTNNFEDMVYTTGGAKIAPKYICSHKNHIIAANIKFVESYGEIASYTTAVGAAFTNQPLGDSIQVLSSNNVVGEDKSPPTRNVTVWGTYTGGGDTVTAEVIAIDGTTPVTSSLTTWQKILGVNADWDPFGTITIRKTTGAATITTFVTAAGSGIVDVPTADQAGGDRVLDIVASAATTKQVGFFGTTPGGTVTWDSQALNGTTTVQSNNEFRSFTNVLIGDIENTVTVTVTSHQYPAGFTDPYLVWWSGTDDPEGYGTEVLAPQIVGSSNQPLLDGVGKITGVADGGDCFFVFKQGSIHRFDGPPFQPTVISYSVGMNPTNTVYRQGARVYFWADSGLNYIDIATNAVVPVMGGSLQRSVTDYANATFGSLRGGFPDGTNTAMTYRNAVRTNDPVAICGDSVNSLVVVVYRNGSAPGANGFIYHEKDELFTLLTSPNGLSLTYGTYYLLDYRPGSNPTPGLMSFIRCLAVEGPDSFQVYKPVLTGFSGSVTRDAYIRWPLTPSPGGQPTYKINRVRPVFDNDSIVVSATINYATTVEVVSMNGVAKSWYAQGVYSAGSSTKSLDGWVVVDGCPYANRHSIGISVLATGTAGAGAPLLSGFVGMEVDYSAGPSKGI